MIHLVFPKFSDIFPEEQVPLLEDELEGIPSEIVINVCCFWMSVFYMNRFDDKKHILFLNKFIENAEERVREKIISQFDAFFEKRQQKFIVFFTPYNLLKQIEFELENYRSNEVVSHNPKNDYKILRALLINNENYDDSFIHQIKTQEKNKEDDIFIKYFWPMTYLSAEFNSSVKQNLLIVLFQSIELFKFLEANPKTSSYVSEYYLMNGVSSWREYISKLTELFINGYKKGEGFFAYKFPPELIKNNQVIKNFILDLSIAKESSMIKYENKIDFRKLRENPILKDSKGNYLVSNWGLIINKIYNSVVYDMYNKTSVRNAFKDEKSDGFNSYKSFVGNECSEKHIFNKFLKSCFNNKNTICMDSNDSKNITSDLYVRIDNKIIFFEFKDINLKKSLLKDNSNDIFSFIKQEINKNFVSSMKKKGNKKIPQKKGVLQLSSQIHEYSNHHKNINNQKLDRLIIFPVLVYTDQTVGMPGVNWYLNKIFKKEINSNKHPYFLVNDLVLINFETLVGLMDSIKHDNSIIFSLLYNYSSCIDKNLRLFKKHKNEYYYSEIFNPFEVEMANSLNKYFKSPDQSTLFRNIVRELNLRIE